MGIRATSRPCGKSDSSIRGRVCLARRWGRSTEIRRLPGLPMTGCTNAKNTSVAARGQVIRWNGTALSGTANLYVSASCGTANTTS